jgi:hypothetical protein
MEFVSTDGWQPNGKRRGRNSGTTGSVNDRNCANCGRKGEYKQPSGKPPVSVWCPTCGSALDKPHYYFMRPTDEETARFDQARSDAGALGNEIKAAQREAGIGEMLEDNPRPSPAQQKRRYKELVQNIARRPEPGGLFYNPLGRALSALLCACNCGVNLVAARFPPVVYMFFLALFGCTCGKKGDIVAIPKDYVVYAIAVYTLVHATHVVNPWAFVNYRALEAYLGSGCLPSYDRKGEGFDTKYDEEDRFDSIRVSLLAHTKNKMLLPMARYRREEDFLGEITSESVGLTSRMVIEIPCIFQGVETVVAVKCMRRQFVMAYLTFAFAVGTFAWSVAHVADFEALQEGVAAATIDNIIESSYKGQRGVDLVGRFMKIYIPIFEMLQEFLIEAFGGRLPTEVEVEALVNRQRGKTRLGTCQLKDGAVSGASAWATESEMRVRIDALAAAVREDLSPSRVTEAARTNKPGLVGKAWRTGYAVANGASAALAFARGGFRRRRDADDDDWGSSKRLRAGEGMPSAAETDPSCKELEPHGSTNPRSGVRRNLLADIGRHQARNAVHQAPIG